MNLCSQCTPEIEGDDWFHADKCPAAKKLRDSYCTPEPLASALGRFTLDVASNPRSLIQADKVCGPDYSQLDRALHPGWIGPDGLAVDWDNEDIFCNGPFSNLLPFAARLVYARSFVFLCNTDHSTKWWKAAVNAGGVHRFDLDKRQQFDPPPHIRRSTNSKPQSLLCDARAYRRIAERVGGLGQWWTANARAA